MTLVQKTAVAEDCYILSFALEQPFQRLGLPVGQHMLLQKTGATYSGKEEVVTRAYSPISGDATRGHFDLLVKVYRAKVHPKYPEGGKLSQVRVTSLLMLPLQAVDMGAGPSVVVY